MLLSRSQSADDCIYRVHSEGLVSMDSRHILASEAITTKIDFSFRRISRLANLSELAEMLFPGNRNQQYTFLLIWIWLKWHTDGIVPNLGQLVMTQGVSRRTLERVRAKMRRMGLLEHITRFDPRFGNREGWILSDNFEKCLGMLAQKLTELKNAEKGTREQDEQWLATVRSLRGKSHEIDE